MNFICFFFFNVLSRRWLEKVFGFLVSNVGVLIVYTLFTKVMALDVFGEDHFFSFS